MTIKLRDGEIYLTRDGKKVESLDAADRSSEEVRTVMWLFLPPRPSPNHEVRHLDGDKSNPSADNLAWGTRQDNADDRERHGRTSRGPSHSAAIKASSHRSRVKRGAPNTTREFGGYSMSRATPGPWMTPTDSETGAVFAASGDFIASVYPNVPRDDPRFNELQANAHLIAAAPELLEALNWAMKQIGEPRLIKGQNDHHFNAWHAAKDAIAKATDAVREAGAA